MSVLRTSFNRRPAFTLVEMLLATALLALLMIGLLAVITDFGASAQALQAFAPAARPVSETPPFPDESALSAWIRLLEDDLRHARTIDAKTANQVVLTGYAALSVETAPRSHHPVRIVYSLEDIAGQNCLIRRQIRLDGSTSDNTRRDLVLCGIRRFILSPQTAPSTFATTPGVATPRWKLQAWTGAESAPLLERLLNPQRGDAP